MAQVQKPKRGEVKIDYTHKHHILHQFKIYQLSINVQESTWWIKNTDYL